MMLLGTGCHLSSRVRSYCIRLRATGHLSGARLGGARCKRWSVVDSWTPELLNSNCTKGFSRLKQWSLLILLLGRGGQEELVEKGRRVVRYLVCTVARQSEVHTSQKFRRTLQLYSAYSRLWGEEAARNMLANLRRVLLSKSRHLLLSAVCFSNFDWRQKIPDESLKESAKDLETVKDLCQATIECHECGKRQVIDQKMATVDYCMCEGSVGYTNDSREYESWRPFIEREHHIVWRQRHHVHNHLFAYKVYGRYDDVSLSSFAEVQLNSTYRTEWDDSALQLQVIDTHEDSNSDLVYWLVKFPHFFADRDYVFKRRFSVDIEKREIVIMSEAVTPNYFPEKNGVHRVNEYWSTMVIRACGDINEPGIEYTLTYFDNPGTSLPQSITNFIAVTGFPNFLKKLHAAALHLQSIHEKGEDIYVSLPSVLRYPRKRRREELSESGMQSEELERFSPSSTEIFAVEDSNVKVPNEDMLCESQNAKSDSVNLAITLTTVENSGINDMDKIYDEEHNTGGSTIDEQVESEHICKAASPCNDNSDSDGTAALSPLHSSNTTTSDTSLHVNLGSKKISVDLLEAMEVVAPDLEKKSLLLKKLEELNEILVNDDTTQNIILQKLQKLRRRLKSFHQEASAKREHSMKRMEELAKRDHYRHMNIDDKTLTQLEILFEAMRHVLKADKDMRTGKMLLEKTSVSKCKEETNDKNMEASQQSDQPEIFLILTHGEEDIKLLNEDGKLSNASDTQPGKKQNKQEQQQTPEDPPPPDSSGEVWHEGELSSDDANHTNDDSGNFENKLRSFESSADNIKACEDSSWSTGFNIPFITSWWRGSKTQDPSIINDITVVTQDPDPPINAQSNVLLAQILYIVSFSWILYSKKHETDSVSEQKHTNSDQCTSEDNQENTEAQSSEEPHWCWHPLTGVYRVYAWLFSSSGVSV